MFPTSVDGNRFSNGLIETGTPHSRQAAMPARFSGEFHWKKNTLGTFLESCEEGAPANLDFWREDLAGIGGE